MFGLDLTDSTQLISAKSALNIISEIEILIDVIATRLVECRKLRLDEITSDEIKILEVCFMIIDCLNNLY